MLKKVIVLVIPLLALIGGTAVGDLLAPKPAPETGEAATGGDLTAAGAGEGSVEGKARGEDGAEDAKIVAGDAVEAGGERGAPDGEAAEAGVEKGSGEGGSGEGGESGEVDPEKTPAWFSFPNQFFVPLVQRGEINGMMVLTLTVETTEAELPEIEKIEHRLRDALLRVLIIHANTGGFSGNYTDTPKLERLREALVRAAREAGGSAAHAVLIEDLGLAGN
ncbi:flagellar basal body-associated FliL family protein [uncultured Paracoccus sp.]|uniref:flagellar basal body-associated FliL family protein n=1 Tax=uncultured Paracoccus sp. TaxID=189685 RepID=UPI0026265A8D|nr:flagellar basal body-associated FliL family protein [uncultured Paracoccus sp.]